MRTRARFPDVPAEAGHYESFYIKAARPGGGQAAWIRHTVHKRPGEEATASLWLTLFDAGADGPRALKVTRPAAELSAPDSEYVRIDGASLAPGRASGSMQGGDLEASWELGFTDRADPLFHLPYQRLYGMALPRTKFLSPHPAALFEGTVRLGGAELALEAWPGMIGHNWGAEHAERWVWLQAGPLDGQPDSFLDLAAGRIKLGPLTTPWVANGMLRLDGREHRLGGFNRLRSTKLDEGPTVCSFEVAGDGVKLRGRVSAPASSFVGWIYADPKGPEHNTLNCSISDLEVEVDGGEGGSRRIEVAGAAAYEIGMRPGDHGVPLQPYPDG